MAVLDAGALLSRLLPQGPASYRESLKGPFRAHRKAHDWAGSRRLWEESPTETGSAGRPSRTPGAHVRPATRQAMKIGASAGDTFRSGRRAFPPSSRRLPETWRTEGDGRERRCPRAAEIGRRQRWREGDKEIHRRIQYMEERPDTARILGIQGCLPWRAVGERGRDSGRLIRRGTLPIGGRCATWNPGSNGSETFGWWDLS